MERDKRFYVPHEIVGAEALAYSWSSKTSSPRQAMRASQMKQDSHILGNEIPRILSGKEIEFAKLQLSPTRIPDNAVVLGRINKPLHRKNTNTVGYTLVYYTSNDLTVHYCDVDTYTPLNHGENFGYQNNLINQHKTIYGHGSGLSAGLEFSVSPAIINDLYCPGVNAKTIYTTFTQVTKDGFIISQALEEKLETIGFSRYNISLSRDAFPLNIYGSDDDYRILPSMTEPVENETLFAYRIANEKTCAVDLTMESLQRINHLHDVIYTCPPGAFIVDIKVYINPTLKLKDDKKFSQLIEISKDYKDYCYDIIKLYNNIKDIPEHTLSNGFNALVTHCLGMTQMNNLRFKDAAVDFIDCEIIVAYPRRVNAGNKLTDGSASKGVIGEGCVWPTECMPITESGVRADIIVYAATPFNRLTTGQWDNQFVNHASHVLTERIRSGMYTDAEAYQEFIDLKYIVSREDYNNLQKYVGDDPIEQKHIVDDIKANGIYHTILPYAVEISSKMYTDIFDRFGIKKEHWSYIDPNTRKTIHSEYPTIIGDNYIYLLGKLPEKSVHAVEFGFLNQFNLPMKESVEDKQRNPHSHTPIRGGIDETRILATSVSTIRIARHMALNGNSTRAGKMLQEMLLTEKYPSRIFRIPMTTSEMLGDCTNIALFKHMMSAAGYVMEGRRIKSIDETNFREYPIPPERRKKILTSNNDSPTVESILVNGAIEINLQSLYEFKAVEDLMKRGLDTGHTQITFSDGSICRMTTRRAIFHFILWEIYLNFYVHPTKDDLFSEKNVNKSFISRVYTKIYYRLKTVPNHMYVVERLWKNINYMNRFNETYCLAYNGTLCGLDLVETINHEKVKELRTKVPDDSMAPNAEKMIYKLTDDLAAMILDGTIPSVLKPYIETESLNIAQIGQLLIAHGTSDDIDSSMSRHVIKDSCFEGITSIESFAVESLRVKKSAYNNKSSIQDAGTFGKALRNVSDTQVVIYDGHCGNEHTAPIIIRPEWKKGFLGRRIIWKGEEIELDDDNIKSFMNEDLEVITAITCDHDFGVCEKCIGYGPPGLLKRFAVTGCNIGSIMASVVANFITQFILSSKHLIKTDAIQYSLPNTATAFMERTTGGVTWRKSIVDGLKKLGLMISTKNIGKIDDLQHTIKSPASWSMIDKLQLVNLATNEVVGDFFIADAAIKPYLSASMIAYMKKNLDRIQITKDGDFIIVPIDDFDFNTTPFKYSLRNKDMKQYVYLVRGFFNGQIAKCSIDDVLMNAYELIYAKNVIPSHIIDIVLKSFRQDRIETERGLKLNFANTAKILERSIPSKLQHIDVSNWLNKPETLTRQHIPSGYDVFFGF